MGSNPASESSFYRILRAADQQHRRGRSQPPRHVPAPTSHAATGPNQSVVLGYHLLAVTRARPVLLPLSDRGHLQPQRVGCA